MGDLSSLRMHLEVFVLYIMAFLYISSYSRQIYCVKPQDFTIVIIGVALGVLLTME
jgi:hypothetical protein